MDHGEFDEGLHAYYENYDYESEGIFDSPVGGMAPAQLWELCVVPTLSSALDQIWFSLVMTFLFRFITGLFSLGVVRERWYHWISFLCGLASHVYMTSIKAMFTLVMVIAAYWFLKISARRPRNDVFCGIMCTCLIYLAAREYGGEGYLAESWEQVRGIQMIVFMKVIALSKEIISISQPEDEIPSIMAYLGYIFCPATYLFGPWISYSSYLAIFNRINSEQKFSSLKYVPRLLSSSLICLGVGSCVVDWIFAGFTSRWVTMIKNALTVRFSHYFISFLSEAICAMCGVTTNDGKSRIQVVDILKIEFPRSLSDVVVNWNKPMHDWLKQYAYGPAAKFGSSKAILITFLISSMLHGLNIELTLVLLSLGGYCYVEYSTRDKLASIFNACIKSRQCSSKCRHRYKARHMLVLLTNFVFSCIAYFHLSYLGVMLDLNRIEGQADEGFLLKVENRLSRWGSLGFASHWYVVIIAFIMYLI